MTINFPPNNIYKSLLFVLLRILVTIYGALALFYLFSMEGRRAYNIDNLLYFILFSLVFIFIACLQTWFNGKVYIYHISIEGSNVLIKWQEWSTFKEQVVPLSSINLALIPAGKNTPYLRVSMEVDKEMIVLKQTYYPKWTKEIMQKVIYDIKEAKLLK